MMEPERRVKRADRDDAHIAIVCPSDCAVDLIVHTLQAVIGTSSGSRYPRRIAELGEIRVVG
jgi:hypothetical protein